MVGSGDLSLLRLYEKIQKLEEMHEENEKKIENLEQRVNAYDKLAARWGGACMVVMALGTFAMGYWEKIKAFIVDNKL